MNQKLARKNVVLSLKLSGKTFLGFGPYVSIFYDLCTFLCQCSLTWKSRGLNYFRLLYAGVATIIFVTLGLHRRLNEIFPLLECYTEQIGSYLPTFRDNLSVQFSVVTQYKKNGLLYPSRCDQQIVSKRRFLTTNLHCVTSQKRDDLIYNKFCLRKASCVC